MFRTLIEDFAPVPTRSMQEDQRTDGYMSDIYVEYYHLYRGRPGRIQPEVYSRRCSTGYGVPVSVSSAECSVSLVLLEHPSPISGLCACKRIN